MGLKSSKNQLDNSEIYGVIGMDWDNDVMIIDAYEFW